MTNWGRRGDNPMVTESVRDRFGKRSIVLAVVAFIAACGTFVVFRSLPNDAEDATENFVADGFILMFFAVIPLLNIVGIICGFMALANDNDSRPRGLIGLLLNVGLLGIGVLLLWQSLR